MSGEEQKKKRTERVYLPISILRVDGTIHHLPDKKYIAQCRCTTGHHCIHYQKDKVAWMREMEDKCPVCHSYYFAFLEKGGVKHNEQYLRSK